MKKGEKNTDALLDNNNDAYTIHFAFGIYFSFCWSLLCRGALFNPPVLVWTLLTCPAPNLFRDFLVKFSPESNLCCLVPLACCICICEVWEIQWWNFHQRTVCAAWCRLPVAFAFVTFGKYNREIFTREQTVLLLARRCYLLVPIASWEMHLWSLGNAIVKFSPERGCWPE